MPNTFSQLPPEIHLTIVMDPVLKEILTRYFVETARYTMEDNLDVLGFLILHMSNEVARVDRPLILGAQVTTILDQCAAFSPNLEGFRTWKSEYLPLDKAVRVLQMEPTPPTWWPVAYAYWLMTGQPDLVQDAARAVYTFRKLGVNLERAMFTIKALYMEPNVTNRAMFLELLVDNALAFEDIATPANAISLLRHRDFPEIVERWRFAYGFQASLKVKDIKRFMQQERRHHARQHQQAASVALSAALSDKPTETTAAIIEAIPAAPTPTTLPGVLELHLPAKTHVVAEHVATALTVMKANDQPWSIDAIVTRVQCMAGEAKTVAKRLVEEALKWLAKNGVLEKVGDGYRILKESNSTIGSQILSMV